MTKYCKRPFSIYSLVKSEVIVKSPKNSAPLLTVSQKLKKKVSKKEKNGDADN